MMKTNSPPFELIPEEASGETGDNDSKGAESQLILERRHLMQPNMYLLAEDTAAAATAVFQDFALQQHMLQVKHQQILQRQILEHQIQKNRELMHAEHERQLSVLLQQAQMKKLQEEQQKAAAAAAAATVEHERQERLRLEILKQKSSSDQSAVASPEVKRHLAEFVLQKRRKEACSNSGNSSCNSSNNTGGAASMSNLKLVSSGPSGSAGGAGQIPQPLLRKTASESNLLKMKSKRTLSSTPYQRHNLHNASPPSFSSSPASSASTSPKTLQLKRQEQQQQQQQQQHQHQQQLPRQPRSLEIGSLLDSSALNSKSLPNIATAVGSRLHQEQNLFKRRSPPLQSSSSSSSRPLPHHGAIAVRRSKSSAILPLRKHLIERSLGEVRKAMDEEQFYYQQKQMDRERLMIRPIEEVMEEDVGRTVENMEVDADMPTTAASIPYSFTARLGPLGLSPLVTSSMSSEYVTRLLPRQPLATNHILSGSETGLGYDSLMLRHQCACADPENHPENPSRILAVWNRLVESGLAEKCVRVARRATLEEIQSCHSETHTLVYGTDMVNRCSLTGSQELHREDRMGKFCRLECGGVGVDADTYWNELETPAAARTAVGTLIELSQKVARNDLRNGFAIIRPPGHHAEQEEAMGFCYFNAVAIAAKQLLLLPTVRRVLIVDWAIHHGNATQKAFYEDPRVLYISLHRHDNGNFYPGTGGAVECGSGPGLGFNINVAWAGGLDPPMGDAEYLAAFRSVIMPVARSYDPDVVLVSAGFDAAAGHPHPIGGYLVSTACFAYMTLQLRQLAAGKVVLALEGGFNLDVLAEASEQCVRALLGQPVVKISEGELARRPSPAAVETLQKTLAIHTPYWDCLRRCGPEAALFSHLEAWERSKEDEQQQALSAMAGLSVEQQGLKSHY